MRGEWRSVRGICRAHPPAIYVLCLLSICGFVTTQSGGWCGFLTPPWEVGLPFGVVELDFHIRVCMSNPEGLGMLLAPPTVRSLEQVAVAKFLLADTFG